MRLDGADMRVPSLSELRLDELALRFGGLPEGASA
jgi:hypothetical protein